MKIYDNLELLAVLRHSFHPAIDINQIKCPAV